MTIQSQISIALLTVLASLPISLSTRAQSNIVPDDTLGTENSQVIFDFDGEPAEVILGGARREQNLFHSFEAFNVEADRGAFFFVPDDVGNVFSRVTGSDLSNIQGVLGTIGGDTPDLYLINPNGIVFGPDARLSVDGSFIATTAEGVQFGEGDRYSTIDPEAPSLLTVNPSALLFGSRSGEIANQGSLQVNAGQSLIFAGGDISIEGGSLSVLSGEGGNIELGATGEVGMVALSKSNGLLGLNFPESLERGDISLKNTVLQALSTGNGGDVSVVGQNIDTLQSQIVVGIVSNSGNAESVAGDINLDASETLRVGPSSIIYNAIAQEARGNAGDITIRAGSVFAEGSEIRTITLPFGRGNAGNINIQSSEVDLDATNLFSVVWDNATGNAGNITLDISQLSQTSGSQISASSFGQGRTGNVIINAEDSVLLDGSLTTIFSSLFGSADEPGGDVRITTRDLSLTDGAQLTTSLNGSGESGDVIINAENSVSLDGFPTGILSSISNGAIGQGGNIRIETRELSLTNSAELDSSIFGFGEGGDIIIDAEDSVTVDGGMAVPGRIGSSIFSTVEETGQGPSGDIQITTDSLFVTNGGNIQTLVRGQGDAGDIFILADDSVLVDGSFVREERTIPGRDGIVQFSVISFITSEVTNENTANGNGGDIYIQAGESIVLSNSGRVSSGINKRESAEGSGGTITMNSARLDLENGASISAQSAGAGIAGDVVLDISEVLRLTDSDIQTTAAASSGGDILVNLSEGSESGLIILAGDADILTESLGDGGDITLGGAAVIAFDDSDIVARSQSARGGNITLSNFFSEDLPPDGQLPFDGDDRVDVNADGQIAAGVITSPDTSFVENNLSELPETIIDTEQLVSGSCIASGSDDSRFAILGRSRLSAQPGDALGTTYGTGGVRSITTEASVPNRQATALPVEPQSVYYLPDGRMLLSRECS